MCSPDNLEWGLSEADLNPKYPLNTRVGGDVLEIRAELTPRNASAVGLRLRRSPDGQEQTIVRYEPAIGRLTIDLGNATLNPTASNGTVGYDRVPTPERSVVSARVP